MKRWWNIAFQVVATAGQVSQLYYPIIPQPWGDKVQLGVGLVQATVGILAHNFNPDGSKAQVPYIPTKKVKGVK